MCIFKSSLTRDSLPVTNGAESAIGIMPNPRRCGAAVPCLVVLVALVSIPWQEVLVLVLVPGLGEIGVEIGSK